MYLMKDQRLSDKEHKKAKKKKSKKSSKSKHSNVVNYKEGNNIMNTSDSEGEGNCD